MKTTKTITDMARLNCMKWLTLHEACIYARRSSNTIKKLVLEGKIYASKKGGEWIVDRESIDRYFYTERDDLRIKLSGRSL